MNTLEILFFVLLFIVFYTYVGYGILLWILVKIKQSFISFYDTDEPEQETCRNGNNTDLPEITLFITAYNEEQVVDGKMKNCQELDYPKEKLHIVWVTDGSNDRTNEKLKAYPDVTLLFVPERKGKTAAMNRGMGFVTTPLVIFTDANTFIKFLHLFDRFLHYLLDEIIEFSFVDLIHTVLKMLTFRCNILSCQTSCQFSNHWMGDACRTAGSTDSAADAVKGFLCTRLEVASLRICPYQPFCRHYP